MDTRPIDQVSAFSSRIPTHAADAENGGGSPACPAARNRVVLLISLHRISTGVFSALHTTSVVE